MTRIRLARAATALLVIAAIVLGAAQKMGLGTICSFGSGRFGLTCPLGYLQAVLASRSLLPSLWPSVGLAVLATVLLGRFFCAWICPTRLIQSAVQEPEPASREGRVVASAPATCGADPVSPKKQPASYSHYALLGGALVSSLLCGFPVFCLICPVGLFFGAVFAVIHFFSARQPSLELLLFPTLLGLELLVLRSWCRSLCPLGALLGLLARPSRMARPMIVKERCLVTHGTPCQVCKKACPEAIDLVASGHEAAPGRCTRCLECHQRCPVRAIRLRWR